MRFAARPSDSAPSNYFDGALDEVRLWSLARESRQIADNFGRNLNGTEPGLAGRWSFNEGDGLVAHDGLVGDSPLEGQLEGGMSNLNRVAGRELDPALPLQYCLELAGGPGYVEIESAVVFHLTNLTIEAWVKPNGAGLRTILMKGDLGYGLAIDGDNHLRYFTDATVQNSLRSSSPLELERDAAGRVVVGSDGRPVIAWNHVAVVVDAAAGLTTFYINGQPAGSYPIAVIGNNAGPIILGKQGSVATANYYQGLLDEVRLWNVPRSDLEIELYAFTSLLGAVPPGLIGYWDFNEGRGLTLADRAGGQYDGVLTELDAGHWRIGADWGMPRLPGEVGSLTPQPGAAGLWIGRVVLNQVNEIQQAVQGASEKLTATADTATLRILLHVAADGQVRMLKDVIVMQHAADTNSPSGGGTNGSTGATLALVTRPELIPNFQGVSRRGGKLVGLRYGTVAYDFDGTELPLLGGVGPGGSCLGRIRLSRDHPTNPYRHKYHPDHASGFDLTRQFQIQFDGQPGGAVEEGPNYGVDRLTGVYRETIVGLHKIHLQVAGTVELNRISTVATLND